MEGESCYYHCVLCNYSTKAKLNLIQHVRSMKHQRSESLRKLQRLQKGLPEEDEDLGQIFTIRRCPSTDPGKTCHEHGVGPLVGLAESLLKASTVDMLSFINVAAPSVCPRRLLDGRSLD